MITRYALACLLAATGCYTAQSGRNHPMITKGEGAFTVVSLSRTSVRGELIAVADTGVLILSRRELIHIPAAAIRGMQFQGISYQYRTGTLAGPLPVADLRRLSRFPGGTPPEVMADLLRRRKQTAPRVRSR